MDLNIEKFSPTKAELTQLAAESQALKLPDPLDRIQLEAIKAARIKLKTARVAITKTGKVLREDALAFQRAVISKEKELVSIIEPEEDRLAGLEQKAEQALERKAREELLPHRRERLAAIGDPIDISDDEILDMDGTTFEGYFNKCQADHNEKIRLENERKQRELKEKEEAQRREQEAREREERARKEERERIEREQKEKEERETREKEEAEERAKRDQEQRELNEKEDKERLEKEERYQAFLKEHGYHEAPQTFHIERLVSEVKLYRLAGILKLNEK